MTDKAARAAGISGMPAEFVAEPWSEDAARWRLTLLPFLVPEHAEFRGGNSNDAWLFDGEVVRICWRADRGRLLREAKLLEELPDSIPHAAATSSGSVDDLSWTRSPRLSGVPLRDLVGELSPQVVRALFSQLAGMLKNLHDWTPSPTLARVLADRPALSVGPVELVWQGDLVPLPVHRMRAVADVAAAVPHLDKGLVEAAYERILGLADVDPFADPAALHSVVHGDATPANVLVHDGRISGLIDFEYARMGPRDLELLSPVLFARGFGVAWLREDYAELFDFPDLDSRLWLYELCCALRGVIWWPPPDPTSPHPPVTTLRALIDKPLPITQ